MTLARQMYEDYFGDPDWAYPDVTDREYHPDGTLKGGRYNGIEVSISRKDDDDPQRTQTLFQDGKPALIHINGKQAINPAFSWHHEVAHIEDPDGVSEDPVKSEFVADRTAIKKLGMSKKDYQNWLIKSDRSKDSPAHIKARTELHNNFAKHLEESISDRLNELSRTTDGRKIFTEPFEGSVKIAKGYWVINDPPIPSKHKMGCKHTKDGTWCGRCKLTVSEHLLNLFNHKG